MPGPVNPQNLELLSKKKKLYLPMEVWLDQEDVLARFFRGSVDPRDTFPLPAQVGSEGKRSPTSLSTDQSRDSAATDDRGSSLVPSQGS